MNPNRFLDVAVTLSESKKPADLRTAVSRAYYASFLTVRDYAQNVKGEPFCRDSNIHHEVEKYLDNSPDIELNELAQALGDLRDSRHAADYEMDNPIPEKPKNVGDICIRAEKIVNTISEKIKSTPS